jgi:hypothetical protein
VEHRVAGAAAVGGAAARDVHVVLVGEGAHGAHLRAHRRVIAGAAPPTPLLPRSLSPTVYGFSDPPKGSGRPCTWTPSVVV